jgi:hypothetical protein
VGRIKFKGEMKKAILITIGLIHCLFAFSQTTASANQLDTAQVIKTAKRYNAYWIVDWYAQPSLKFDELSATWTVVSSRSKHTARGQCKHTNGCRLVITVTLVIDARTGKVKSRKKTKKIYPNYE